MEGSKAGVEVDRPFAGDIVRYLDVGDLAMPEIFSDNIISVYIAITRLVLSSVYHKRFSPFSALQIADGVWKDETMACADCLNNTARKIVFAST